MADMEGKKFHLGDVLSMVTGRVLSPTKIDGYWDIKRYMLTDYNKPGCTYEINVIQCRKHLIEQYPWLGSRIIKDALVVLDSELTSCEKTLIARSRAVQDWLSKLASGEFGISCEGIDDEMFLLVRPLSIPSKSQDPT